MTTTAISSPQRHSRIAARWAANPALTEAEVAAAVDAEMAVEATQQAEAAEKSEALAESFTRLTACCACGERPRTGTHGFCERCLPVVNAIRAERHSADVVGALTRREVVEAFLDRRS